MRTTEESPSWRIQYPLDLHEGHAFRVRLTVADGSTFEGVLADVSAESAGIRFPAARAPGLAVAEKVDLAFGSFAHGRSGKRLLVSGSVLSRTEEKGSRHYRFQLGEPETFQTRIAPALLALLERRQMPRIEADPRSPVEVVLERGDEAETPPADSESPAGGGSHRAATPTAAVLRGTLVNISATGLSIRISGETERELAHTTRTRLSFSLPERPGRLNLEGILVNRQLVGQDVLCGILFDPERSPEFTDQQSAINEHVVGRLLETIRA